MKTGWGSLIPELKHSLGFILNSLLEFSCSDRQGSRSQLTGSLDIEGAGVFFPLATGLRRIEEGYDLHEVSLTRSCNPSMAAQKSLLVSCATCLPKQKAHKTL